MPKQGRPTMAVLLFAVLSFVPFIYHDNRIVIQCTINGKGPFSVILDTGAPDVTVTPETARKLGLTVRASGTVTGAGNNAVESGSARLTTFSVGDATLRDVDASVIDLTQIRTKFHFPRLDGIVGYPLLEKYVTFVNVDDGTISFEKKRPAIPHNATATPFNGVLPVIRATIGGVPTTVIVDTGDRSSLTLFGPFAKHYGFFGRYPSTENIVTGYGLGGPIYADVFTLPQLEVLGTNLDRIVTRASRQTGGVFASTGQGGSIGTGVLKRFNIVYDYAHGSIFAWPSKYFSVPDQFVPPPTHSV